MERADLAGPATGTQGPQLAEHLGGGGFLRAGPAADADPPAAASQGAFTCGICYTEELGPGGSKPCVTCGNASCSHWFHRECLEEHLKSGGQTAAAGFIGGSCPYCSGLIELG